ncbi:MAG: zinc-binding alcohol dehydrogenase [Pseudomonadota bacterium]
MTQTKTPLTQIARALWYVDRELVALHEEELNLHIGASDVLVETLYSGLSRGTERLVYFGAIPTSERETMRAPRQMGNFPFPVKYGYCAVGIIRKGPQSLWNRVAFCLHPHQDFFVAPASTITLVPPGLSPKRATLAANMETAINAHWDAQTAVGDRIIVIGAGIVGLLTAYVASRIPGTEVTLVDVNPAQRTLAQKLDIPFSSPAEMPADADVVFHTSASEAGLQAAIDVAGFEGRIIEMSWFGSRGVTLGLGGQFHSKRLQLISSQVGQVAAPRRPRWTYGRRLAKAIDLLDDPRLDCLVADEIPFDRLPELLPRVFSDDAAGLPPVIRYGSEA